MAVMLGGRIIDKPGIFELGHTIAIPDGIPCGCGKCGCLDQYSSIRGIKARSGKKFHVIVSDSEIGDSEAIKYLAEGAHYLAGAVSNAAYLLNVDRIVLCGRIFESSEVFREEFIEHYNAVSGDFIPKISFADASAAPIGAALIAMNATLKKIAI